jgi:hypothetical protein
MHCPALPDPLDPPLLMPPPELPPLPLFPPAPPELPLAPPPPDALLLVVESEPQAAAAGASARTMTTSQDLVIGRMLRSWRHEPSLVDAGSAFVILRLLSTVRARGDQLEIAAERGARAAGSASSGARSAKSGGGASGLLPEQRVIRDDVRLELAAVA